MRVGSTVPSLVGGGGTWIRPPDRERIHSDYPSIHPYRAYVLSLCTELMYLSFFWLVAMGGLCLVIALIMLGIADNCVSGSLACGLWHTKMPHTLMSLLVGCSPWGRRVAYCTLFAPSLLVG